MVATLCQLENFQNRGPCLGKTIKVTKNIGGSRGKQHVKATYYCKILNLKKKTTKPKPLRLPITFLPNTRNTLVLALRCGLPSCYI